MLNIKDFTEKQQFLSPLTGKPILMITRISDGTAKTVPTVHRFAKVDQHGQPIRDDDGKIIFKTEQHEYPTGRDKSDRDKGWKILKKHDRHNADLEWDKKDKRVWWCNNPVMETEVFGNTTKTFIKKGGHKVGTHDEFFARMKEVHQQIFDEKDAVRVKEKEKDLEIAIKTGTVIADKMTGKSADSAYAWTAENDEWLKANFAEKEFKDLAKHFKVSVKAVKEHCAEIGLEEE
jgi:hypothetical protein